jgi:thiol-disulfide isomerase/thioredoxin
MKTLFLITILGLLHCTCTYAWDSNSLFFGGNLEAAKDRAKREDKLLILEFTAKWCLPCRFMEKNVFLNENVQKFSERFAIILQIDIDENKNLKEDFKIEVLPTIILMKASGEIIAKKEESLSADGFMTWLETNKDTSPDTEVATTEELTTEEPVAVQFPNLDTKDFEPELMTKMAESTAMAKSIIASRKDNNYHLQAGVFTSKENADNLVALLTMNFQEEIKIAEETTADKNKIFKVRIGNFSNKEEAIIFQQVLDKYKFKAVIRHN